MTIRIPRGAGADLTTTDWPTNTSSERLEAGSQGQGAGRVCFYRDVRKPSVLCLCPSFGESLAVLGLGAFLPDLCLLHSIFTVCMSGSGSKCPLFVKIPVIEDWGPPRGLI